jgi:ribosome-binding factor A
MSNRTVRVNELVQREISDILRRRYQSEAVAVTVSEVKVAPDLRDGWVYIAVVGDEKTAEAKLRWVRSKAPEIREELGRRIVLKYLPKFQYLLDKTAIRGARIMAVLEELEHPRPKAAGRSGPE